MSDYPLPKFVVFQKPIYVHNGTSDGTTTSGKLIDSGAGFNLGGFSQVRPGMIIQNTTDGTSGVVTAVDDGSTLSVSPADLAPTAKGYVIYESPTSAGWPVINSPVYGTTASGTTTAPGDTNYLTTVVDSKFDHFVSAGDIVVNITDDTKATVVKVIDDKNLLLDTAIETAKAFRVITPTKQCDEAAFNCENITSITKTSDSLITVVIPDVEANVDNYNIYIVPNTTSAATLEAELQSLVDTANAQAGNNPLYIPHPVQYTNLLVTHITHS